MRKLVDHQLYRLIIFYISVEMMAFVTLGILTKKTVISYQQKRANKKSDEKNIRRLSSISSASEKTSNYRYFQYIFFAFNIVIISNTKRSVTGAIR